MAVGSPQRERCLIRGGCRVLELALFFGGRIINADIVFWDAAFRFFSGSTGCSSGFYIEDIAAHEFGHALGLGHSTTTGATMYPSVSSCNAANWTLVADDIAGVRFISAASEPAVPGPEPPNQGQRLVRRQATRFLRPSGRILRPCIRVHLCAGMLPPRYPRASPYSR